MNGGMAMSSYKDYKKRALQNPDVKAEYDVLSESFCACSFCFPSFYFPEALYLEGETPNFFLNT